MEDALVQDLKGFNLTINGVLILVLMEDALVLNVIVALVLLLMCLNPCFNGRCTSTAKLR